LFRLRQQRFDLTPQVSVSGACNVEERLPRFWLTLQSRGKSLVTLRLRSWSMAISSLLSDNVTALQATGGIRSLSYLSINPWQKSPESGTTGETACPTEQHGRNQSAA